MGAAGLALAMTLVAVLLVPSPSRQLRANAPGVSSGSGETRSAARSRPSLAVDQVTPPDVVNLRRDTEKPATA